MHTHFCLLCNKEFVRRNKELKLDKQFCGVKCSKSLDGLKLLYSDEEALKIRENYLDSKRQSEEKFIKKYGEELGKEKWKNYNSSKGSTKESMIKKYGEIEGNIRWNSYIEKVSHSEEKYIKNYGEELGKEKWKDICKNKARDVKNYSKPCYHNEETYIARYGEELGKEKWKYTSLKKKKTLARKFINKTKYKELQHLYIFHFKSLKLVKIGITENIEKRIKYFKTHVDENIDIIHIEIDEYNIIRKLEQTLHNKFDKYNILIDNKINGFTEFFDDEILKNIDIKNKKD